MVHERDQEFQKLLFSVRVSTRYHVRRRMFFDTIYQWLRGLSVVFGSATFVAAVSNNFGTGFLAVIALVVTVATAISIVVEPAGKARLHDGLARRFIALEQEMLHHYSKELTEGDLNRFAAQRLAIETDEPPIMNGVVILAHNEMSRAMDYTPAELYHVCWYHRVLAHFINFRVDSIVTNREWEEKAKERDRNRSLAKDTTNDKIGAA